MDAELIKSLLNSSVVNTAIWAVLILVIFWVLRSPIAGLLERIEEFGWRGVRVKVSPALPTTPRPAHDFWLGHDLMFTMHLLAQGADLKDILLSLQRSIEHASALELREYEDRLRDLQRELQMQVRALSWQDRQTVIHSLEFLRMEVDRQLARPG